MNTAVKISSSSMDMQASLDSRLAAYAVAGVSMFAAGAA